MFAAIFRLTRGIRQGRLDFLPQIVKCFARYLHSPIEETKSAVWEQRPGKVDFDVPAALLKTGDYQVSLRRAGGGSKGSVASYYFRVQ
jgi:hypothetical protein